MDSSRARLIDSHLDDAHRSLVEALYLCEDKFVYDEIKSIVDSVAEISTEREYEL